MARKKRSKRKRIRDLSEAETNTPAEGQEKHVVANIGDMFQLKSTQIVGFDLHQRKHVPTVVEDGMESEDGPGSASSDHEAEASSDCDSEMPNEVPVPELKSSKSHLRSIWYKYGFQRLSRQESKKLCLQRGFAARCVCGVIVLCPNVTTAPLKRHVSNGKPPTMKRCYQAIAYRLQVFPNVKHVAGEPILTEIEKRDKIVPLGIYVLGKGFEKPPENGKC